MPTGAEWALQKAVYQHLVNDTELIARLGGPGLYDDVPPGATFPYVTLGQNSARDDGNFTGEGRAHTLTLHVWSRTPGRKEVQEIIALLSTSLHDTALTLEDHTLVNLRFLTSEARRDLDGETYHGIVRFRAVTEPAA